MAEDVTYYCMRCNHRFSGSYTRNEIKERTCPECMSNSVRMETEISAALWEKEKKS